MFKHKHKHMEGTNNNNKHPPQLNTTTSSRTNRGTRCCCCLFGILWKLLIVIIILVLLAILVSYILLQPRSFKVHVTHSNLTKFDYVHNTNTLHYNLVLNFTIRNPNKKLKIYFDNFTMQALEGNHPTEAHAFYQGLRFDTTSLKAPWFSYLLDTKSSVPMSVVFAGKRVMVLDVGEFERDRSEGSFGIDLKIYFQIRFKIGDFIANGVLEKAKAKCGIKVPLSRSNGTMVDAFEPTKCDVDF